MPYRSCSFTRPWAKSQLATQKRPIITAPMTPAKRVARPRMSATPIATSPNTTRKLTALIRPGLLARETHRSWVGFTIAPSAEPGSVPAVAPFRNPVALNALLTPSKWTILSRPAYRNPKPTATRRTARPLLMFRASITAPLLVGPPLVGVGLVFSAVQTVGARLRAAPLPSGPEWRDLGGPIGPREPFSQARTVTTLGGSAAFCSRDPARPARQKGRLVPAVGDRRHRLRRRRRTRRRRRRPLGLGLRSARPERPRASHALHATRARDRQPNHLTRVADAQRSRPWRGHLGRGLRDLWPCQSGRGRATIRRHKEVPNHGQHGRLRIAVGEHGTDRPRDCVGPRESRPDTCVRGRRGRRSPRRRGRPAGRRGADRGAWRDAGHGRVPQCTHGPPDRWSLGRGVRYSSRVAAFRLGLSRGEDRRRAPAGRRTPRGSGRELHREPKAGARLG